MQFKLTDYILQGVQLIFDKNTALKQDRIDNFSYGSRENNTTVKFVSTLLYFHQDKT